MENQDNPKSPGNSSNNKLIIIFLAIFAVVAISAIFMLLNLNRYSAAAPQAQQSVRSGSMGVLSPKGPIAEQERRLIIVATLLMLIIVIPVFILTIFIVWRYRAGKIGPSYSPNMQSSALSAFILWAIPIAIIFIIAILIWTSTHALDPYKPIASNVKPLTIQVVALQWKWLFIYPEQNIATLNFIEFPAGTPINFKLTGDGPMNSFWIPELGGQMYAMAGMSTQLHLMASSAGEFPGRAAEISGQGFSGMKFMAKSTSNADFEAWVQTVKQTPDVLNLNAYNELAKPSENNQKTFYSSVETGLYNSVIMKFMMPASPAGGPMGAKDNKDTRMESMPGINQ